MPLPTVILPGYLAGAPGYQPLQQALQARGYPAVVVPLKWQDWLQTVGGRSVTPILRQVDATVQQAMQQFGASRVNLVGHSAGGWLARIYLGDQPYDIHAVDHGNAAWAAHRFVATLVTLGTPHTSQERWTRKNLDFVNQTYPGAFYPDVHYVCVAGKAIYGQRWRLGGWLAYSSYELTCGTGDCWGDGITPIAAAHLAPGNAGANAQLKNLILEGVQHSPKGGLLVRSSRPWYGSPQFIPQWSSYLV